MKQFNIKIEEEMWDINFVLFDTTSIVFITISKKEIYNIFYLDELKMNIITVDKEMELILYLFMK